MGKNSGGGKTEFEVLETMAPEQWAIFRALLGPALTGLGARDVAEDLPSIPDYLLAHQPGKTNKGTTFGSGFFADIAKRRAEQGGAPTWMNPQVGDQKRRRQTGPVMLPVKE